MMQRDHNGDPIPYDITFTTHGGKNDEPGTIINAKGVIVKGRSKANRKSSTVNLHFPGGQVRAVHIPLITHFNNKRVR